MGSLIFLTALFLLAKGCEAAQCNCKYLTDSTPTLCATSYLQPACGQFTVPAIAKPIITPVETIPAPPAVPSYPDFGGYPYPPPMPMPPVFINGRDKDDDWHHLLYFLIFALKNRGDCGYSNYGYGGNYGSGCGCGCNCGGGCAYNSNSNFGESCINNGNDVVYVPYPIAVPMNCHSSNSLFTGENISSPPEIFSSSVPSYPSCNCNCKDANEINLIIRTECQ